MLSLLELIVCLITAALIVLSAAGFLGRLHKYLELTSHFRAQYLLASATCFLICILFVNWWCVAGALICALINFSAIAPFYRANKPSRDNKIKSHLFKLAFANVERCNTAHDDFIALVKRHEPDVVVVQEVDFLWVNSLQALHQKYPFSEVLPRGGGCGIAFYSRFSFKRLPIALPEGDLRPGLMVILDIEGTPVSLLTIHTRAPLRRGHFERRNKALIAATNLIKNLSAPRVFVGDLNATPWSPWYQRLVKETKLIDARKGFGLLPSWPTAMLFPWLMIPIDHCLVSEDIRIIKARTGERIGSDHLPLIIEMEIPTHGRTFDLLIQ